MAIDPMTAMLIANTALSAGKGVSQMIKGRRAENMAGMRPTQTTPDSMLEATDLASSMVDNKMPGYDYKANLLTEGAANTNKAIMDAGGDSASIISGITNVDDRNQEAINALNVADANFRLKAISDLMQQLNVQSQQEQANFDWNTKQEWLDMSGAAAGLKEAGWKNMETGLKQAANLAIYDHFGSDTFGKNEYDSDVDAGLFDRISSSEDEWDAYVKEQYGK